jgi:hypothetical protein
MTYEPPSGEVEPNLKSAAWLDQALEDLEEFRALEEDWDSYGAAPITDVSLKAARRLLRAAAAGELNKPYFIAPSPRGGVQLEWHGKQDALEVEISPQAGMSYLLIKNVDGDRSFDRKENVDLYDVVMAVSLITSNLR